MHLELIPSARLCGRLRAQLCGRCAIRRVGKDGLILNRRSIGDTTDIMSKAGSNFIQKLSQMLLTHAHLIQWDVTGTVVIIPNPELMASHVLPQYFKHDKFSSFVRQLHLYGFSKSTLSTGAIEFRHDYFIRGRPDLMELISRKSSSRNAVGTPSTPTPSPKERSMAAELASLQQRNERLTQENAALHQRLSFASSSVDNSRYFGLEVDTSWIDRGEPNAPGLPMDSPSAWTMTPLQGDRKDSSFFPHTMPELRQHPSFDQFIQPGNPLAIEETMEMDVSPSTAFQFSMEEDSDIHIKADPFSDHGSYTFYSTI